MSLIRGNALTAPLADESVDLIVTSPPYFALRSYTDGGEHYDGQIGSEATPAGFIAALLEVTRECVRVLKPSGSLWVNLGDKYAGSGGHNNDGISSSSTLSGNGHTGGVGKAGPTKIKATRRSSPDRYNQASDGVRAKSLMGLPWRYALGCIDDLGLILRAEVIWSKPNGLPESVQDRVRRSHEQWFHFTREPRYFSAVDEIREGYADSTADRNKYARPTNGHPSADHNGPMRSGGTPAGLDANPLGKLPGSVWTIPTEPLRVPDHLPQHFAAFPSEWPKRIILGWSPSGVCVECGQGRRPVVEKSCACVLSPPPCDTDRGRAPKASRDANASPGALPPTRPAVVLDPFAGTGTTVAVANALGRHGVGLDLSADYLKLARWRCQDPGLRAKVLGVDKPKPETAGQLSLMEAS